jgi:peptidoglycan/LPS O-acetylase OafA/YrhL
MKSAYYKELDGVRAIAALMIIVFHFFQGHNESNIPNLLKKASSIGQTGVSLFFVLSGFLITRILLASRSKPNFFLNFYGRRGLRIFPLYYTYLAIHYFLVEPLINKNGVAPFNLQYYYWFYFQNFADTFNWQASGPFHFWSLAVEEHFYLFWPIIIYFCKNRNIFVAVLLIIFIALISRIILHIYNYEVFYLTFSRMDELAIGAILALVETKDKLTSKNAKYFLIGLVLTIIPTIGMWTILAGTANAVVQVTKFLFISSCYFFVIGYILCVRKDSSLITFLTAKPLLYTGKVSYGLYIYHPLSYGLFALIFRQQSLLVNFAGGLALTYLLSTISFYAFESRFLILKKYFV